RKAAVCKALHLTPPPPRQFHRHKLIALLVAAGFAGASGQVWADQIWDGGGGDDKWTTDANWDPDNAPSATDNATISNANVSIGASENATSATVVVGTSGGTANLYITEGGTLTNTYGRIGDASGSVGSVTVDGSGSTWTNTNALVIGYSGRGRLNILNGGQVSNDDGLIGYSDQANIVTVDGVGSIWTNSGTLSVGYNNDSTGTVNITTGGQVLSNEGHIGRSSGSVGSVTVDGAGSIWTNSIDLSVGTAGTGTLSIMNGGKVNTGSLILGFDSTGVGTLNIGAAATAPATGAGILDTASVTSGPGVGTVQFNHTGTNYYFTRDGTSTGAAIAISGNLSVVNTAGYTVLTGANTYTGATTVNGGTLDLTGSLTSAVSVANGAAFSLRGSVVGSHNVTLSGGGILNAYQNGSIGGDLIASNGSILNFYLPATIADGNTLLTVTGNATVDGSQINIALDGGVNPTSLAAGHKITLIDAGTLSASGINPVSSVTATSGIAFIYDFGILVDPNDATNLIATLNSKTDSGSGSGNGITLNAQTKALSEGFLAATSFLNQAADFIADRGITAALQSQRSAAGRIGFSGFAAIGGGNLRHNTGSHIDVDGYALVAGASVANTVGAGELTIGAFLEHGEGDYDSYNSFANAARVHGKGDTDYTGGGLLAHLDFNKTEQGNFYAEASARGGRVKTDFRANFPLISGLSRATAYDAESTYASAHVGSGYRLQLNEQSSMQFYGQYLWSHQGGDTVKLTTGETVKFKAVDSQRTRLGARWNYAVSRTAQTWLGAAWEHEYAGKAKASIYGHQLDTPKLKGDTGLLEVGVTLSPTQNQPLSLDFGLQGYVGKREGVTGGVRVRYAF
ncbi:MAG: hypothetical protein LBQ81_11280, partial [Zoogloeaceae bacterium]|nr:hypothetical protein [Zoogloeaceae bacterium]